MKIVVDADACPRPVLQICRELGTEFGIEVWTVANYHHRLVSDHHIMVDAASQQADLVIFNLAQAGDVVITQDWGLGALVLSRKATALSPGGYLFREETVDFLLEEREMKARWRRSGGRTRGPRPRSPEDDRRFRAALLQAVTKNRGQETGA